MVAFIVAVIITASFLFVILMSVWMFRTCPVNNIDSLPVVTIEEMMDDAN